MEISSRQIFEIFLPTLFRKYIPAIYITLRLPSGDNKAVLQKQPVQVVGGLSLATPKNFEYPQSNNLNNHNNNTPNNHNNINKFKTLVDSIQGEEEDEDEEEEDSLPSKIRVRRVLQHKFWN
jgi:hypothetical protein